MKHRIRVAFVTNDFLVGGVQRLHVGVFAGLDPARYDMHLVTLLEFPSRKNLYDSLPRHITVHRLSFKGFKDIRAWYALYRLLGPLKPDVVISSLFFANTVCRVLKPLLGYAVITTENNTYVDNTRGAIVVNWLLSHITYKIIAVSETVRDFTARQERIPRDKFVVVRSGIDVARIAREADGVDRATVRKKLGVGKRDLVAINVARLTKQKNQGALIEAFADFSASRSESKLLILGEGALRDEYEKLLRDHAAEDRIKLLGNVMDVISHYAASDFFVSPSHIEGFGIAHVEAFACGIPVLTTKTAGPDEMIDEGKNGLFIAESSSPSIREGLERMAALDLPSMRMACRATASRYDIRRTVALYEDLIQGASAS